jgi:hypothetical protein
LSVVGQGLYTFTAVDGGRQVSLSGTFYWEMLDVEKGKKLYSLPLLFKGRSRKEGSGSWYSNISVVIFRRWEKIA